MGAASSRDRFNSRLEAAPTGVFFSNLDLPDKRIPYLSGDPSRIEQRFFEHGFLIGPDNISAGDDADQFGGVIG